MRSRIVSVFSDALASSHVPALDVATRFMELGEALLPLINPIVGAKYGLEIASFIVENVSVPPEVEQAIDKRSSMAAIGNLNEFVKYQMGKGMEAGTAGGGGMAAELAVGFGIAQQMMQQGLSPAQAGQAAAAGAAKAAVAGAGPDLLTPADVAKLLSVPEGDVMAILESGELKAKKIGSSYRITRAAFDAYVNS
jgi:excisionase family DNA binding protein